MKVSVLFLSVILIFSSLGETKKEVEKKGEAVILLHGLGRTSRSMKKMAKFFKKQGYDVYNLDYPSRKNNIEYLSDVWLSEALEKNGSKANKRHFVTHSLGGILLRSYLQENKINNLGRIVMLSPPNQGCHVTDELKDWWFYKKITGPAGQQLGTDKESVPNQLKKVDAEVGVITGNRSANLFFSWLIPGPDDGKVSVECAKLEGMKDFLVLPVNHTYIMQNSVVIKQAGHFIAHGQFIHS